MAKSSKTAKKGGKKSSKKFTLSVAGADGNFKEVSTDGIDNLLAKSAEISIIEAEIKDGFCNFTCKIIAGAGAGFKHKVWGKDVGLVLEDMTNAFEKLNVHLACVDQVFKHQGIDIKNIDKMHNHETTADYHVDSFKVRGEEEDIKVILSGSKGIGVLGRIDFDTPEIELGEYSSYQWYNELKQAIEKARLEVELYNGGKYEPVHKEEEVDENQLTIDDQINEGKDGSEQNIEFEADESDATAKKV